MIQLVFGWENYHLHHFMCHGGRGRRRMQEYVEYKIIHEYDEPYIFQECKEERLYKLSDVFSEENPLLEYEYDFGACWEHEVKFEGVVEGNPDLEYPACVEGKWANRREDHQDEDEDGDLLPGYEGKQFNRQEAQHELRRVFAGKWPLKVNNTTLPKCCLCAFHLCSACNGRCCKFCLKAEILRGSAPVSNRESGSSEED